MKTADLEKNLVALVDQREQLTTRMVELETEGDGLGVDVEAADAVERLKAISSELEALRRVQPEVDARITALRSRLNEVRSAEDVQAVEKLRPAERKAVDKVVKLTDQLEAALVDLDALQREIVLHRGFPKARLPTVLYQGVKHAKTHWRLAGSWEGEGTLGAKR